MNAALLFSANAQPTDGLSLNSTPGAVLPEGDGPTNSFSTVMDGALSQQSRGNSDANQGSSAAGSEKPAAPVAPVPAVIRQILAYLSPGSGKPASTTEGEDVQVDEVPDLDADEKLALSDDAAAMMMACQLAPQLPLPVPTGAAASATANTMTITAEAGQGFGSELPSVGSDKSTGSGLLDELSLVPQKPSESDRKVSPDGSRVLTRSPKGEAISNRRPASDQSSSLVKALVPSNSELAVGSQVEPVRDRLPVATLLQTTPSDDVVSSDSMPATMPSSFKGQVTIDSGAIVSAEIKGGPNGTGTKTQSVEPGNGVMIDETEGAAISVTTADRGGSDKPVSTLNRRSVYRLSEDGSGLVAGTGTGGAKFDNRTMKSNEQDQSAGLRLQRLPTGTVDSMAIEGGAGDLAGIRSGLRPLLNSEVNYRPTAIDLSAQGGLSHFDAFDSSAVAQVAGTAAERVEKVEHLILKEASVVRQSGAESLAVVLKPDAQTELFLQINHRAGQMEATVRFDRGDAASLGLYWPQLQESLARMDVQLQPMKDSTPSGNGQGSFGSFSSADQQNSSGQRTPRSASWDGETSRGESFAGRESTRPSASRARRQSGWESWA